MDADWAGDTDTRRSHTGYILMMNVGPISWKNRRQDNVSLSTSEAKFVAASQAGQEALYPRDILKDFGYQQNTATQICEDNLACVAESQTCLVPSISCIRSFYRVSCSLVTLAVRGVSDVGYAPVSGDSSTGGWFGILGGTHEKDCVFIHGTVNK